MTTISQFTTTNPTVSVIKRIGNYIWYATGVNALGKCHLIQASPSNLSQVYFDIEITTQSIVDIVESSGRLYVLFDGNKSVGGYVTIAQRFSAVAPTVALSTFKYPVASSWLNSKTILVHSSYVYILGTGDGDESKIVKYNYTGTLQEIIYLDQSGVYIDNVVSMTVDNTNNFWIVTNDNPVNLIRVWYSGGDWRITQFVLDDV